MAMGFIDHTRRKDIVKQNIISIMDKDDKNKVLGVQIKVLKGCL